MASRRAGSTVMSAASPLLGARTRGRHLGSLRAWILVVLPPRYRPIAWSFSPFLGSGGGAMSFDVGAVGHDRARRRVMAGQGGMDRVPDTLARPAIEPIGDGRVGTVVGWAVPQGMPVRRTWTMPLRTCRSSTCLAPRGAAAAARSWPIADRSGKTTGSWRTTSHRPIESQA